MSNIIQKYKRSILLGLSYLYLTLAFSYIVFFISYTIRTAVKPIGWAIILFFTLIFFIAYIAINHIIINRVITNKLLIIIEVFLFVAILTLIFSDVRYEHYLHIQYLQRAGQKG